MGQSSISMLNKVGYSMFWGSMWDNKVSYARLLKEDVYLDKFFDLIFNDSLSVNVFNIKSNKKKPSSLFFGTSNNSDFSLYKYLKASKKINCFNSKIWILRYQNWIIIYYFSYLKQFSKNFKKQERIKYDLYYRNNFSYTINLYEKINKNLKISYNLYNQNKKKVFF